ncbi:MAG TPA: type IV pilus twitching motility protein PilT [Solirubrobacterales bacterium]|nr:type IV pilus twitching motility protein PilT [Solirubrobacterales bacterium]
MFEIETALRALVERGGSDLHIKVGSPAMARVEGELGPLTTDAEPLGPEQTEAAFLAIAPQRTQEEFAAEGEADFAHAIAGVGRFRINAFRQRGSVSLACRAIPFEIRTAAELGLPQAVLGLAEVSRGIVLLTGTTGSGKSTTLAAMIDHINSNWARHIVTLEDPVEYLHRDKRSIVNQREVGADTESFPRAMRRILRQDPDVILIGEMRDEETVRTALSAAETGHLVLSTLHTLDAPETINRILDFFPPHLQQQARVMLATTLAGVISQRLVPGLNGGRVPVAEILVATGRIKDLILNPEETGKISEAIAEGSYYGMQTFDQDLLSHVTEGRIAEDVAYETATSPHDFKLMLAAGGRSASGIEQLAGQERVAPEAVLG